MPFTIERNDLSTVTVDAIVIAANEQLQITGGVGLTVGRAAGLDDLQAACNDIGFCPCGSAVATPAFGLPAKVVVHTVGPVWQGGELGEADFLRSAYDSALECAVAAGARSIALPLISAGTYGFPANVSLAVARESIRGFLNRHDDVEVRLVLYSRESVAAGMASYLDIAEYVDDHYVDRHPVLGTLAADNVTRLDGYPIQSPPTMAEVPGRLGAPTTGNAPAQEDAFVFGSDSERLEAPAISAPDRESAHAATKAPAQSGRGILGRIGQALTGKPKERHGADDLMEDAAAPAAQGRSSETNLTELLESLDAPFSTTLLALIDERGLTDAQVYKRANMSRQLFSKIRSNADYRPTKRTALALAVALGLDLDETDALLARAGFTLSPSSKADVIVEYFIGQGNHDIFEINEALYAFDQPLL